MPMASAFADPFSISWINSLTYWMAGKMMFYYSGELHNKFRKDVLGLPPITEYDIAGIPEICGFSSFIVPKPNDWGANIEITGYWFFEDIKRISDANKVEVPDGNYSPSPLLAKFLESGEAPIYLGFGSMPILDTSAFVKMVTEVLGKVKKRGIICANLSEIESSEPTDSIIIIKSAPHWWLLPKCCAAVHHGGAGTTAAVLSAGIPNIIFPVLGDQPFWAYKMGVIGVGPNPFTPFKKLNAAILEQAIRTTVDNPKVIAIAKEFGEKIRSENGLEVAVQKFNNFTKIIRNVGIQCNWKKDEDALKCETCSKEFSILYWKYHCKSCGSIFCSACLKLSNRVPGYSLNTPVQVCKKCLDAITSA